MGGVPTDYGQWSVLISIIVGLSVGFSVAVKWLDNRRRGDRADLEARISHLEGQVQRLENGHATATQHIVKALALLPPDMKEVQEKLIDACTALA